MITLATDRHQTGRQRAECKIQNAKRKLQNAKKKKKKTSKYYATTAVCTQNQLRSKPPTTLSHQTTGQAGKCGNLTPLLPLYPYPARAERKKFDTDETANRRWQVEKSRTYVRMDNTTFMYAFKHKYTSVRVLLRIRFRRSLHATRTYTRNVRKV